MEDKFSIINMTKGKLPSVPFLQIKNDILGKNYSLSLAFVDEKKSKEINKKYRNKDNSTNVLSFLLSKKEGEILLCPAVIKNEVKIKKFNKNYTELTGFLVIHGMLHLKGLDHSSTMERAEEKYDKKYFRGNRRRLDDDKSRGRRILQRGKKS